MNITSQTIRAQFAKCGQVMPMPTPPKVRAKRGDGQSSLEKAFAWRWKAFGGPAYETQHRFHPTRKWRFDAAWVSAKVAVELHGGTWSGGRHTRGRGFAKDREKMNTAASMGWIVFEATTDAINKNFNEFAEMVEKAIKGRSG